MNERIWDKFLTERDKAVFAAGGFGARAGRNPFWVNQALAYLVWRGELGGS